MSNATVRWFDALGGKGVVRMDDGRSVFLYYTAIVGVDINRYVCPADKDRAFLHSIAGKRCTVELIEDTTFVQVSKLTLEVA